MTDEKTESNTLLPGFADAIAEVYFYLAHKVEDSQIYHDDRAKQSATATLMIAYNQQQSTARIYANKLKAKLEELEEPNNVVIKTWFAFLDQEFQEYGLTEREHTQIKAYIISSIASNKATPDRIRDYIIRIIDHRLTEEQRARIRERYGYMDEPKENDTHTEEDVKQ